MARVLRNRVYETSTTTGTGAITLDGAYAAGFNTFYKAGELVAGDTFPYVITDSLASPTWYEAGEGTLLTTTTFSRDVEDSTNNNAAIDLPAGTHIVFLSPLASWLSTLVTSADVDTAITTALADYYTADETDTAIAVELMPYAQTVAVTAALNALSASIAADYLTIATAAATYATPASVTTQISNATILTSQLSGTLAIGQFADNVITSAKIVSLAASKLTGTVAPANGGMGADTSSLTGIYKFTAGVPSVATPGTDYLTTVSFAQVTGTATNAQLPTAITGKTIDNSVIGGTTRAGGYFSSVGVGISSSLGGNVDIRQSADGTVMVYGRRASDSNGGTGSIFNIRDLADSLSVYRVDTGGNTTQGKIKIQLGTGGDSGLLYAVDAGDISTVSNVSGLFRFQQYTTTGGTVNPFQIVLKRDNANLAGYSAHLVDVTEDVVGTANNFILNLRRNTVSRFAVRSDGTAYDIASTAATNAVANVLQLGHNSTGTVTTDFGGKIPMQAEGASGTENLDVASVEWAWDVATELTRRGRMRLKANYHTTARTVIEIGADSSGPLLGLNGNAAVARPTYGAPTGTLTRTTFDPSTVTLAELAQRVAAMITDFRSRGDFA